MRLNPIPEEKKLTAVGNTKRRHKNYRPR